ncbi:MAG: hypothetical protein DMG41_07735 [Acidobacteria bacterium]|nr:MAG: hypothetical protein DMG41_07735 [Acidobacteriota bacterium]
MTDTCLPSAGALNSFPTAESRHAKDPGPRGCCVPGEMHIFVWTIRWTVAWANRVSNDVSPGTTEQPISASIPCGGACVSTSAYARRTKSRSSATSTYGTRSAMHARNTVSGMP